MNNEEEKSGRRNQEKSGKRNEEKRDDKKVEHITLDNPDMLNTENGKIIENYDIVRYQKGEGLTGNVGKNGSIFISDNLAKDKERPHLSKTYEIVEGDDNENCGINSSERVKTGMFIPIPSTQEKNNVCGKSYNNQEIIGDSIFDLQEKVKTFYNK